MCKTHLRVQQAERVDLCVCVLVKCWPHNYCDLLACACITTKKKTYCALSLQRHNRPTTIDGVILFAKHQNS